MDNSELYDIPGTYILDGRHCMKGYHLNMFCMSLNKAHNREAFKADPAAYLDQYPMTPEQRAAVEARDYIKLLRLGGNIYYTFKIAICDGKNMQYVGGLMDGTSEEEFKKMMLGGGRKLAGNRSIKENQTAQTAQTPKK